MTFVVVPNVSEGRDGNAVLALGDSVARRGARVLDVHSDRTHNRSVFTVAGGRDSIVSGMVGLASAARNIDLRRHHGAHPRLGGLDVCPVVTFRTSRNAAVDAAWATGEAIAHEAQLPVFLYGHAARRKETMDLPSLRRGGLAGLIERTRAGLPPDFGPAHIDEGTGVVCVGARDVLVAFNVWIAAGRVTARRIAGKARTSGGGPPGIRALGIDVGGGMSQVSMNLIDPAVTAIDAAFEAVAREARELEAKIEATEIVGLVPERYLPDPRKKAARLLMAPSRSLEAALEM